MSDDETASGGAVLAEEEDHQPVAIEVQEIQVIEEDASPMSPVRSDHGTSHTFPGPQDSSTSLRSSMTEEDKPSYKRKKSKSHKKKSSRRSMLKERDDENMEVEVVQIQPMNITVVEDGGAQQYDEQGFEVEQTQAVSFEIEAVEASVVKADPGHDLEDPPSKHIRHQSSAEFVSFSDPSDNEMRVEYGWVPEEQGAGRTLTFQSVNDGNNLKRWLTDIGKVDKFQRQLTRSKKMSQLHKTTRHLKSHVSEWYKNLARLVQHWLFQAVVTVATFWALFGPALQVIVFHKSADLTLAWIMLGVLLLFLFEFVVLMIIQWKTFPMSFFFFMDLIALLSLIPDVLPVFGVAALELGTLNIARVGRGARAAARTARFARLLKFLGICKRKRTADLLRKDKDRYDWMDSDWDMTEFDQSLEYSEQLREKTVVGERLEDAVFQKVFLILLAMFVLFTLLEPQYGSQETGIRSTLGTLAISRFYGTVSLGTRTTNYVREFFEGNILELVINGGIIVQDLGAIDDLRDPSRLEVTVDNSLNSDIMAACANGCRVVLDVHDQQVESAWLDIANTVLVIVLLVVGTGAINRDVYSFLLAPIERMVAMVKTLALNPFATLRVKSDFEFETGLVESMLAKMGVLLQVGFGAAGGALIRQNLSSSGSLVPIIKGRKTRAIFGQIHIKYFASITETLQEEITVFVNKTARLVHSCAAQRGGFPTSNSGDSFQLVWVLPEQESDMDDETFKKMVQETADGALETFLDVQSRVGGSKELKTMLKEVQECSSVEMQFGLHTGWAIAGAIGSPRKVDAVYLSGHVGMAAALDQAAEYYGVELLLSHDMWELLSVDSQGKCLLIDFVRLGGQSEPTRLYAADANPFTNLLDPAHEMYLRRNTMVNMQAPSDQDNEHELLEHKNDEQEANYEESLTRRQSIFLEELLKGVELYISGEWAEAKTSLLEAQAQVPRFRPFRLIRLLLQYMERRNYQAPAGWAFRELTS